MYHVESRKERQAKRIRRAVEDGRSTIDLYLYSSEFEYYKRIFGAESIQEKTTIPEERRKKENNYILSLEEIDLSKLKY